MQDVIDLGLVLELNVLENVSFNLQRRRIIILVTVLTEFIHNHSNGILVYDMCKRSNILASRLAKILNEDYDPKNKAYSVESLNADIMDIVEACNSLKPRV